MKGGIGGNLRISGVERDLYYNYLMFLSRDIDIKLCQLLYQIVNMYNIRSYHVTRTPSNDTAVYWSRYTDGDT